MTIHTHNDFHLGDNLVHLNFLRRVALLHPDREFVHAVHGCHYEALLPLLDGVSNASLVLHETRSPESRDVWKNAGAGTPSGGFWERHPLRNDFVGFHMSWFAHLAAQLGVSNPICRPEDLLFDYPALKTARPIATHARFDFLVVNSRPCSGQLMAYDKLEYMDPLIAELSRSFLVITTQKSDVDVPCTQDFHMSVHGIGRMSLQCRYIVGVATGPLWPTFNVWNQESVELRLVLLENEDLSDLGRNVVQVGTVEQAMAVLRKRNIL